MYRLSDNGGVHSNVVDDQCWRRCVKDKTRAESELCVILRVKNESQAKVATLSRKWDVTIVRCEQLQRNQ